MDFYPHQGGIRVEPLLSDPDNGVTIMLDLKKKA